MIGTPAELNLLVIIASFIVGIVLIPVLKDKKAYIPRFTSISTATAIYIFTFVFFDEGLILGGIAELISAIMWSFIFIWRGKK